MDINFELYKMFYQVAKNKSFSKAAKSLYISQPAVTQSIQKLETQIGGKLFFRNKKGITLTEEGKNLLEYIRDSIEVMNNAENKFSQYVNLEEGTIRIKSGDVLNKILLFEPLKEFVKIYPNICIEISDGITYESMNQLNNGDVDMVTLNLPYDNAKENVTIIPCINNELGFFASKEYAQKIKKEKISSKELLLFNYIFPKKNSNTREIIDKYLRDHGLEIKPKYECSSMNAIAELIKMGVGIGFLNKKVIKDEITKGEIIEIKIDIEITNKQIGIATMNKNIASFATIKLAEIIKEYSKRGK